MSERGRARRSTLDTAAACDARRAPLPPRATLDRRARGRLPRSRARALRLSLSRRYGRRDLDDLHALNIDEWRWSKLAPKGKGPEKRSGHQACAVENSLYVFGGWNCTAQFADLYILDTVMEPPVWTNVENPESKLEKARWNHAACSVMALWKTRHARRSSRPRASTVTVSLGAG